MAVHDAWNECAGRCYLRFQPRRIGLAKVAASPELIAAVIRALKVDVVIGPSGNVRVMVTTQPVDFRKESEGLAALVRETMRLDPLHQPRRVGPPS